MLVNFRRFKISKRIQIALGNISWNKSYWNDFSLLVNVREGIEKKSRILETKHLSTNVDSSDDAIGGWTKNTPKPDFFEKQKKPPKMQKLKNV